MASYCLSMRAGEFNCCCFISNSTEILPVGVLLDGKNHNVKYDVALLLVHLKRYC